MSKNVTDANEAARIAYRAQTGRFDASRPNLSNTPKGDIVNPMQEAKAVEMVAGKKYLMVINVPRNVEHSKLEAIQRSVPVYDEYFRARGIDLTLMITDEAIQLYELEGACPNPSSV